MFSRDRCSADCAQEAAKRVKTLELLSARRLEKPAKRVKTLELLSTALDIVADDDKKDINGSGERFERAA